MMTTSMKRRRKARRARSGVVMVEAIIAISMIIVMFGGVVYFHNAYDAKAKALRVARMQAWRATEQGCEGGGRGQASELAAVPINYVKYGAAELPVSARHEMKCNERHIESTTPLGVLKWSGLGEKIGNVGNMIFESFKAVF